jgi:hypothetical protein
MGPLKFWRRDMFHDRLKKRRHVFIVFVQLAQAKPFFALA